jgi:hypothetical protein
MKIIHSADTGTIEGADTCFIYDVPDDLPTDETEQWLVEHLEDGISVLGILDVYNTVQNGLRL